MTQRSTTETGLTIVIAPDEVDSRRDQAVLDVDLRGFFDLSPELLCVAGFDLYFKYLNPAWERVLGWTIDELMAAPLLDFVHPEDRRRAAEDMAKVTKESGTAEYVNRYRHADGSYRWLSWTATTAVDSDLFYAAARDITEDRRREQNLRASEERFRTLIQSAPGGILISDDSGRIIFANELVEDMFGYGPDELIDEPIEILVPEA
ncbi:MAG: PAS domain S-box protein, partial [Acidimicrobiia bacterium]|nr:PAS domain S-box protein [Acidimicrobiia bacterium]